MQTSNFFYQFCSSKQIKSYSVVPDSETKEQKLKYAKNASLTGCGALLLLGILIGSRIGSGVTWLHVLLSHLGWIALLERVEG